MAAFADNHRAVFKFPYGNDRYDDGFDCWKRGNIGSGNKKESNRAAEQVVLIVFVISLSITVVCILGGERLLRLVFGTVDDTVMKNSLVYFMITVLSYPFLALFSAGAAFATLLSRVFCTVVIFYCLRKPRQTIIVKDYLKIRPEIPLILAIMAIGVPSGIENGMFQFGKLAVQSTVSTMGTIAMSAQAMTVVKPLVWVGAFGIPYGLRAAGDVKFLVSV